MKRVYTETEVDELMAAIEGRRPYTFNHPFDGANYIVSEDERDRLAALVGQLRSERDEAWNEIATGFDAIFPYVMEANDAEGNPLSLSNKIDLLVSERNAFYVQGVALRTRLQQVEAERMAIQRAVASSVLIDPSEDDEPAYSLDEILNGINGLIHMKKSAVERRAQAEAERDGELERKLQAQEDAADAIKRANELADEINTQTQRAHGFKVERDEAWAVLRQMCEERTERFKQLADLQREREEWQVALQAAECKITRLEEQRVGIKHPV